MREKLRVAEMAFAIAGVASFSTSWIMSYWLESAMPTRPDVELRFRIPMIIHGRTIYLSSFYDGLYNTLFWGGLALFVCAVLIDFYGDPFSSRTRKQ
jgi:hypothetical protein